MITVLLLTAASALTPYGGVEYRPLARSDLSWVDEGRTTGLAVGEFDGFVRPSLSGWAGAWITDRTALSLSLGVARLQNTTDVDTVVRQRHWGVIRPGLDVRWALTERRERRPLPWVILGTHLNLPSSRDVSTGYTRKEQKAADEQAAVERSKLAGFGARLGLGADYEVLPGLGIGAQWALEWHQAAWRADDLTAATSWLSSDAALLLIFRLPQGASEPPP